MGRDPGGLVAGLLLQRGLSELVRPSPALFSWAIAVSIAVNWAFSASSRAWSRRFMASIWSWIRFTWSFEPSIAAETTPPVLVKLSARSEIRCAMPSSFAVGPSCVRIARTLSRFAANAALNLSASNLSRPEIASWSSVEAAVPVEMPTSLARFPPGARPAMVLARESRRALCTVWSVLELNSTPFVMSSSVVASRTFCSDTRALRVSITEL